MCVKLFTEVFLKMQKCIFRKLEGQERDGKLSCALLLTSPHDLDKWYTSEQMIAYCKESRKCRRQLIYQDFPQSEYLSKGCLCCDVCKCSCKYGKCDENLKSFHVLR